MVQLKKKEELLQYVRDQIDKYLFVTCGTITGRFLLFYDIEKPSTITIKKYDYVYSLVEKERAVYLNILKRGPR